MAERTCSVEGCEGRARARSYCTKHYQRFMNHGSTADPRPDMATRFWAKVEKAEGCWIWRGAMGSNGYGVIGYGPRNDHTQTSAHRIAYELTHGPIPPGLEIDHLCRNTLCVNPAHLEAVTHSVNIARGTGPVSANFTKTACPQGHDYDDENTYTDALGARHCRTCRRDTERRRWRLKHWGHE